MSDLSTAIVNALDLGAGFLEHDERPAAAAQAFYQTLGADRLDALVEALWVIIEHPSAQATEVLQAWHVMQVLKGCRRYLL
ncbi:hypothetical protein [Microvirga yunnanensis]|uniref:hypothetical protein n=1 Tax=Microvirga yunnanensis TaxID=2953740 RepID=UPI0021C6E280|nr:hypothetical protein [Microvirga sp. HBU67655]